MIFCYAEAPTSLTKWWQCFDVIDGNWCFSALDLYAICHTINSVYKRMMHEKDERQPNILVIFALL